MELGCVQVHEHDASGVLYVVICTSSLFFLLLSSILFYVVEPFTQHKTFGLFPVFANCEEDC